MKIAFLISAGRFPSGILQELRAKFPQHQLIPWARGESSPATDIEVLLVLGEVTAAQMARQTKLALIQTVTAGYEEIDTLVVFCAEVCARMRAGIVMA